MDLQGAANAFMRSVGRIFLAILFVLAVLATAREVTAASSPENRDAHVAAITQLDGLWNDCQTTDCGIDRHEGHGNQTVCGHVVCCAACAHGGLAALTSSPGTIFPRIIVGLERGVFRIKGRNVAPATEPPRIAG
jgi:hypothetical protein